MTELTESVFYKHGWNDAISKIRGKIKKVDSKAEELLEELKRMVLQ